MEFLLLLTSDMIIRHERRVVIVVQTSCDC